MKRRGRTCQRQRNKARARRLYTALRYQCHRYTAVMCLPGLARQVEEDRVVRKQAEYMSFAALSQNAIAPRWINVLPSFWVYLAVTFDSLPGTHASTIASIHRNRWNSPFRHFAGGAMTLPPSTSTISSIFFFVSSPQHSTLFQVDIRPAFVSMSQTRTLRWKPPYPA